MILPESYKNKTKIDIELKVQTKNYFYIKIMCSYQSDKTEAF